MWGWASELYSYNDWVPASRYVNPWVLSPAAKIETYRRRMEQEISSRPPQCVVEAIGPTFFGEYGPDKRIVRLLPGIAGVLARCYTARTAEPTPGEPFALLRPARCLQGKLDARLKPGVRGYRLAAIKPWT